MPTANVTAKTRKGSNPDKEKSAGALQRRAWVYKIRTSTRTRNPDAAKMSQPYGGITSGQSGHWLVSQLRRSGMRDHNKPIPTADIRVVVRIAPRATPSPRQDTSLLRRASASARTSNRLLVIARGNDQ